MPLHIVKLCVGVEEPAILAGYIKERRQQKFLNSIDADNADHSEYKFWHKTRMFPRRKDEILDGGSLYWVMSGRIRCRQKILDIKELDHDEQGRRCKFILDPELHLTKLQPKRPFQGWRYLEDKDAPKDWPFHSEYIEGADIKHSADTEQSNDLNASLLNENKGSSSRIIRDLEDLNLI